MLLLGIILKVLSEFLKEGKENYTEMNAELIQTVENVIGKTLRI